MLPFLAVGLIFLAGLFLMSLGIAFMVQAHFGLSPWDVLHVGLTQAVGLTMGTWSQIIGVLIIIATVIMTRERPTVATLLNMILIGAFVDLILGSHLIPPASGIMASVVLMLGGIAIMGFGTGMYIAPRWGAGPRDGFMLALSERTGLSIARIRTCMELTALALGWFLGGPVFIGTILFSFLIGPIVQWAIKYWDSVVGKIRRRGELFEDINQGPLRPDYHDGTGETLR